MVGVQVITQSVAHNSVEGSPEAVLPEEERATTCILEADHKVLRGHHKIADGHRVVAEGMTRANPHYTPTTATGEVTHGTHPLTAVFATIVARMGISGCIVAIKVTDNYTTLVGCCTSEQTSPNF